MVKVLFAQLGPTPCDPMDCSPPGSSVHGILQARLLERYSLPVLEFQPEWQYWLPFPSPGDLPYTGIEPRSHTLQADSLPFEAGNMVGTQ